VLEDGGSLQVVGLDDVLVADGEHGGSGYWYVDVPADTDVAVRIEGDEHVSSVWRARTPSGRGYWLTGALFTQYATSFEALLKALEGFPDLPPAEDLAAGKVVHLWGQPLDPDAWAGAVVTATGGDGKDVPMFTFASDDKGVVTEAGENPVDFFLGVNAAPGEVTLHVEAADGTAGESTYPTRGGDLVTAAFFDLGEPS
jgi:hypothetical protein